RFREECREAIAGNFIDILIQDVRFSLRMLRKSPGFALIAVTTIALSIGATTAVFSVVEATLLRPLPYAEPAQLVSIQADLPGLAAPRAPPEEGTMAIWGGGGFPARPMPAPAPRNPRSSPRESARRSPGLTIPIARRARDALTSSLQKPCRGFYPPQNAWTVR